MVRTDRRSLRGPPMPLIVFPLTYENAKLRIPAAYDGTVRALIAVVSRLVPVGTGARGDVLARPDGGACRT